MYTAVKQELTDEGWSSEFITYATFELFRYQSKNIEFTSEEATFDSANETPESTENEEPERTGSESQ